MAGIVREDVRWADLDPTIGNGESGKRPVLILSKGIFNLKSGTVIAVALTSQQPRAGFPLTLDLENTTPPISLVTSLPASGGRRAS